MSDQARTGRDAWSRLSNADTDAASGIENVAQERRDHSLPRHTGKQPSDRACALRPRVPFACKLTIATTSYSVTAAEGL